MEHTAPERLMRLATIASVCAATLLVVAKAIVYFDSKSVALLSSLADSALDLLASGVTLLAVRYALSPADAEHRFGHGKAEPLSGLGQAAFVAGSAVLIMVEAISRFRHPAPAADSTAGIGVMLFSIAVTLVLLIFQRYVIRRTGSLAVSGDSAHYAGDLLMNIAVIAALFLSTNLGIAWADPAFGVGISVFMLTNATAIARRAASSLMDHELPQGDRDRIVHIALQHPKVKQVHALRTRSSGFKKFIQMHIELPGGLTLLEAHRISDDVEKAVESEFPEADIIIHQDPEGVAEVHSPDAALP